MLNVFSDLFVAAIVVPPAVAVVMMLIVALTPRSHRETADAQASSAPMPKPRAA
jgi:hypothetical protein